jgi:D-alanine-D-alanine ligase
MKKNIGIFFGGRSAEHEISIITAMQAIKAIDKDKYDVTPIYIGKDGVWYTNRYFWLTKIENYQNQVLQLKHCTRLVPSFSADGSLLSYPSGLLKQSKVVAKIDVAFPVFHGAYGEDGCFQGIFEVMNIPYVGSNVAASAVCMNKILTKEICSAIEIPIIEFCKIEADLWAKNQSECLKKIKETLNFPVIVKPNNLGSSIGVSKVAHDNELADAIDLAAAYSGDILIERCVTAIKEVNCSVAETEKGIEVSECEEPLVLEGNLLGFAEKYLPENNADASKGMASAKRKLPADISDALKKEIQKYSAKIFEHLGCSGVARIDFIIDTAQNRVCLNEINTIPGSLAFYLWEASGKNFSVLLSELIENAVKKYVRNGRLRKEFKSNVLINISGGKLGSKLSTKLG